MGKIFSDHFEIVRQRLSREGEIANSFRHNTNKGNIREAFVKELLDNNTSQFCSVGSGEIIHREMDDGEDRNQIDVVLYNNRYPKLSGAGGVDMFFVETVSSFVEVKSKLTKDDVRQAAKASKRIKTYPYAPPQNFNPTGMIKTPRPFSYLFAYDSTAKEIKTVVEWMQEISAEDNYNLDKLRETEPGKRPFFPNWFLDGIFVLNKGFVFIDAMPFESLLTNQPKVPQDHIWVFGEHNELEILWVALNLASEKLLWNDAQIDRYLPEKEWAVSD